MKQIRIGTLVDGVDAERVLPQIISHGFESFSLTFWQTTSDKDLSEMAKRVKEIYEGAARLHTKTVEEMALDREEANKNASEADKAKVRPASE